MKKNHRILILPLAFFIIAFLFLAGSKFVSAPENMENASRELKVNGKIIDVEIADTVEKQVRGLSGRQSLPEDQGMLFVFSAPDHYSFWMKDMLFNLDFIWISGNTVVEIDKNAKPEDYAPPKILIPKNKIDKVLEVNAGTAERLGIKAGDKVEF